MASKLLAEHPLSFLNNHPDYSSAKAGDDVAALRRVQEGHDARSVTVEGATYGTSKEALAAVERQQGGKPNARYSVRIGGERVTSKEGIEAAKPSDKTAGARGLSHIIEARQRKDGKSAEGALRLLDGVVEAIARGEEFNRIAVGKTTRGAWSTTT